MESSEIESIHRRESRRVLATLVRLLGDWDLAEEALQDAYVEALGAWPERGVPSNPRAWLVSAGRFRAIDRIRRGARQVPLTDELAAVLAAPDPDPSEEEPELPDDRLRMVFTCCHPALSSEARVALTLREVCGLATEDIAAAFLVPVPTLAQRIVRAKNKIREARIPFEVPSGTALEERLDSVLQVVYLVFNEGYYATRGAGVGNLDLAREAMRLGDLLLELIPDPEVQGLVALMCFQESRRDARSDSHGDLVLLEDQDRSLWDARAIARGQELVDRAIASRRVGPYVLQAAIASLHASAPAASATDWAQIAGLYQVLRRASPSPVVELNSAVAEGMALGPEEGLRRIEALLRDGRLDDYALAHAAKASFLDKMGRGAEAAVCWRRALDLTPEEGAQRRFLEARISMSLRRP